MTDFAHNIDHTIVSHAKPKSDWQERLHAKMQAQSVDLFVANNHVEYMPPRPLHIAVRRALGIAVYSFVRYPMPKGPAEIRYERIV
jgi:hypothetical protein